MLVFTFLAASPQDTRAHEQLQKMSMSRAAQLNLHEYSPNLRQVSKQASSDSARLQTIARTRMAVGDRHTK